MHAAPETSPRVATGGRRAAMGLLCLITAGVSCSVGLVKVNSSTKHRAPVFAFHCTLIDSQLGTLCTAILHYTLSSRKRKGAGSRSLPSQTRPTNDKGNAGTDDSSSGWTKLTQVVRTIPPTCDTKRTGRNEGAKQFQLCPRIWGTLPQEEKKFLHVSACSLFSVTLTVSGATPLPLSALRLGIWWCLPEPSK